MKTIQAEGLIACAWPGGSLIGRGDVSAVGRILFAVELSAGQLRYVFDAAAAASGTGGTGSLEATSRPPRLSGWGSGVPRGDVQAAADPRRGGKTAERQPLARRGY